MIRRTKHGCGHTDSFDDENMPMDQISRRARSTSDALCIWCRANPKKARPAHMEDHYFYLVKHGFRDLQGLYWQPLPAP